MMDRNHDPALTQFRSALLQRTQGVIRRRRWQRRGGFLAVAALLYAAGFYSSQFFGTQTAPIPEYEQVARDTAPLRLAANGQDLSTSAFSPADAQELELAADVASLVERPDLLLRAGDAYLAQHGDIERALRCYRTYLAEVAPASAPATAAGDESWLLAALRQNRL